MGHPPSPRDLEQKREALREERLLETFPDIDDFGAPRIVELSRDEIAAAHERFANQHRKNSEDD